MFCRNFLKKATERANAMERREGEREEAGGRRKYFLRHDATDNNLGSNAAAFLPSSDSALAVLESDIHARSARQEGASGNGIHPRPAIPRGHSMQEPISPLAEAIFQKDCCFFFCKDLCASFFLVLTFEESRIKIVTEPNTHRCTTAFKLILTLAIRMINNR